MTNGTKRWRLKDVFFYLDRMKCLSKNRSATKVMRFLILLIALLSVSAGLCSSDPNAIVIPSLSLKGVAVEDALIQVAKLSRTARGTRASHAGREKHFRSRGGPEDHTRRPVAVLH